MTKHVSGQCHCGKNQFKAEIKDEFQFICHCKDCRVLNGGGHLCGIMIDEALLTPAPEANIYHYPGGSGDLIEMSFCGSCSTQLYAKPTHYPDKVVLRANTLPEFEFESKQPLFPESAYTWDKIS